MGGHGGLWLGIRHSDIFGSAGSTSGGVNIIPFPKNWKMADQLGDYESNKEAWRDHTVINLVPQLKPGQLNIIFDCGVDDFFFEVNNELHQALLDAKIPHDYITRPGAHTAQYWRNSILYQLLYFNEIFTR
jgi:S-formylglutathione hydrolase FrmB